VSRRCYGDGGRWEGRQVADLSDFEIRWTASHGGMGTRNRPQRRELRRERRWALTREAATRRPPALAATDELGPARAVATPRRRPPGPRTGTPRRPPQTSSRSAGAREGRCGFWEARVGDESSVAWIGEAHSGRRRVPQRMETAWHCCEGPTHSDPRQRKARRERESPAGFNKK
jgi:hypothetical protein